MIDIISTIGIIVGIIFFFVAKKKHNLKVLKLIGGIIILTSIVIAAPDFVKGFINGFNDALNS
jgi:divalent metal cation (Fe/Co/Zn/Cd) transporter